MACACSHSVRFITQHTICLDIFYSFFNTKQKVVRTVNSDAFEPLLDKADTESQELPQSGEPMKESGKKSNAFVYLCFFLAGMSLNLCWSAISFIVPYWILRYGPSIWQDFVVCYNVPGFPILLLQLFTDEKTAKRFGTRKTYIARLTFSFAIIAALIGIAPLTQQTGGLDRFTMLVFMTMVGIAVGSGHGWIYSVVSYYPPMAVSYLAAGGGGAVVLLLGLTLLENYPENEDYTQLVVYFEPVFFLSVIGLMCIISLLLTKDSVVKLQQIDHETYGNKVHEKVTKNELKHVEPIPFDTRVPIYRAIWSPLVSIFLLMFSIVAAVTLIASIPSKSNNTKFPAYILYVTSIAAFIGNEIAVYWRWMATKWLLVIFSAVRFLMLPFLLVYSSTRFWVNDLFILAVLSVFAASGAFGVSKCYSLCAASVSVNQQASASNYLNIVLYVGVYFGLAFPYVLPLL